MREICPSCGKDMIVTTEAFEVNGDAVRGIPTSCAEAAARRPSPQSSWTWCSATEPRRSS